MSASHSTSESSTSPPPPSSFVAQTPDPAPADHLIQPEKKILNKPLLDYRAQIEAHRAEAATKLMDQNCPITSDTIMLDLFKYYFREMLDIQRASTQYCSQLMHIKSLLIGRCDILLDAIASFEADKLKQSEKFRLFVGWFKGEVKKLKDKIEKRLETVTETELQKEVVEVVEEASIVSEEEEASGSGISSQSGITSFEESGNSSPSKTGSVSYSSTATFTVSSSSSTDGSSSSKTSKTSKTSPKNDSA